MAFLVGHWSSGNGRVDDTGGTSRGTSTMAPEAGGAVLLRRDHVDVFNTSGHRTGGFDVLMTIYAEAGTIRAAYFDPQHVIHYTSAQIQPGHAVTFASQPAPGTPTFRLSYTLSAPDTLSVRFGMVPPGGTAFREIAAGEVKKTQ